MPPLLWVIWFAVSSILGALLRPKQRKSEPQQPYGWQPQTFQRETDIEYSYGIVPIVGNAVGPWTSAVNTRRSENANLLLWIPYKLTDAGGEWNKAVRTSRHGLEITLLYGDGPVVGLMAGVTLNDKALTEWSGLTYTERLGTDDQAAFGIEDRFEKAHELEVAVGTPVTVEMTDSDYSNCAICVGSLEGLVAINHSNATIPAHIEAKIEIRVIGGAWHTLFDYSLVGQIQSPVRWLFLASQTYPGGTPFTITPGDRHEWRVTCNSEPTGLSASGHLYILATQEIYGTAYRHPGLAGLGLSAFAMDSMPSGLDVKGLLQAKVIEDCARTTIAWSRNPAQVTFGVITDPVIKGNGGGTPYSVDYYRGSDPATDINTAEFVAAETWCDTLVPDGKGGTEAQFEFDGTFTEKTERWEQAMHAARNARMVLWHDGRQWRCYLDQLRTPSHIFCDANIQGDCEEEGIDNRQAPGKIFAENFKNRDGGYVQAKIGWADPLATTDRPLTIDAFGISRTSHFIRIARYLCDRARYVNRTYAWGTGPCGMDAERGQTAYLQHDSLGNGYGAKIASVTDTDTVVLDTDVAVVGGVTYKLIIQTLDVAGGKHVTAYTVASLTGSRTVNLTSALTYTPVAGDICIFAKESDLRIVALTGTAPAGNGHCKFTAEIYDVRTYARDSDAPNLNTAIHLAAVGLQRSVFRPISRQDLLDGYPQDRLLDGDVLDTPTAGGITFTGDGVDTVTWTCSGAEGFGWIRLQGESYPIQVGGADLLAPDDTVLLAPDDTPLEASFHDSTVKKYIYFDPNAEDPTVLYATDDLSELAGQERFLGCVNIAGVAKLQNWQRIGIDDTSLEWPLVTGSGKPEDNADVTATHTAASIAGQGALATDNTVNTATIDDESTAAGGFVTSTTLSGWMPSETYTTVASIAITSAGTTGAEWAGRIVATNYTVLQKNMYLRVRRTVGGTPSLVWTGGPYPADGSGGQVIVTLDPKIDWIGGVDPTYTFDFWGEGTDNDDWKVNSYCFLVREWKGK